MNRRQQGFTLIEIALVLVIIGLLLGGVLKGRELITSARARNVIQQQENIKAAYYGFFDRYGALPGDYANATSNINGIAATPACNNGNGDGDGQIETANNENILVWEHLSKAGYLHDTYTCAATIGSTTTPTNAYGQYIDLVYDANYAGTAPPARTNLKTGAQVPSNILAEMDRKIDDGNAIQGSFRAQLGGGVSANTAECYSAAGVWVSDSPGPNCGGVSIF